MKSGTGAPTTTEAAEVVADKEAATKQTKKPTKAIKEY